VWALPGRFFQSLPVPCGASPDVTSPDVTDSREKRNPRQSDFLGKRFGRLEKKYLSLGHFQDVRVQFWDIHGVGFQDPNLEIFWT
jgi:hypothetical protein